MNAQEWWRIGGRLLGVYFLVSGAVPVVSGTVFLLTGGWSMAWFSLAQGLVAAGAGLLLIRRCPVQARTSAPADGSAPVLTMFTALQLLGLFLAVSGGVALLQSLVLNLGLILYLQTEGLWMRVVLEALPGLMQGIAGAVLVAAPRQIADRLARFARGPASQPVGP